MSTKNDTYHLNISKKRSLYIHDFDNNAFGRGCFKLGRRCVNCLRIFIDRFMTISIEIISQLITNEYAIINNTNKVILCPKHNLKT